MTPEQALARLRLHVQPTSEPTLSEQELSDLLAVHALADSEGNAPNTEGWVGTWDIRKAAYDGWLIKAGKVANDVTYRADDASYNQSEAYAHCLTMADRFKGAQGSFTLGVQ